MSYFTYLINLFSFSIPSRVPVPGVSGYPLRPEMIESTYMLYTATQDHAFLEVGKQMMRNISYYTKVECGFAAVTDVLTKVSNVTQELLNLLIIHYRNWKTGLTAFS